HQGGVWRAAPPLPHGGPRAGGARALPGPCPPPPRPRGRLWLLRPVGPFNTVGALLAHLDALASAAPAESLLALTRTTLAELAEP
ncbi:hypothetical protein ACFVZQ_20145, partial [Streptomyces sp. NPDC059538]